MLDIRFIRDHPDKIRKAIVDKRVTLDLDRLLAVDERMRALQVEHETLLAERNTVSKAIGAAPQAERDALKARVATIKPRIEALGEQVKGLKEEFDGLMLMVPQPARADVPLGKDDRENVEIKRWGTPPTFDFAAKDHMELGLSLGLLDAERGVRLAGSRSYFLKGDGARLEQAVLRYTYDKLVKKGYTPFTVPVLVKEEAMVGTGYFPQGRDQAYCAEKDGLALVGTAEVSLVSFHADEIVDAKKLPLKFMAMSPCFRREAGTYGKDTHGLYRVHQFYKIEQVILAVADERLSEDLHAELLRNAEELLEDFGLPYRVSYVCTGDMGQGQYRKHDIETWMPSRKAYGETHSCSTFLDYQARRLKIRYKDADGKNVLCYTLNNTAIASPRVLIPLLECGQEADGRVRIPECLRPYLDGRTHLGL